MTFDEWFIKYPLPAEIDTMDDTDREQWTWALRSAYKTGAAAEREVIAQSLDKQADLAADDIDRQWAQEMAAAVRARG